MKEILNDLPLLSVVVFVVAMLLSIAHVLFEKRRIKKGKRRLKPFINGLICIFLITVISISLFDVGKAVYDKVEEIKSESKVAELLAEFDKEFNRDAWIKLSEINPDLFGYIESNLEKSVIVQTDDDFYETHSFDGSANGMTMQVSVETDKLYQNLVIENVSDKWNTLVEQFDGNNKFTIWYETEFVDYEITHIVEKREIKTELTQEEYNSYFEEICKNNLIETDAEIKYPNHYIVLQTDKYTIIAKGLKGYAY